jgi:nitrite reductase/ring-hydroxylating ferredoxin subunit
VADIGLLGRMVRVNGKTVDGVDIFVGGSSGPGAVQGVQIMENVPCEQLPQVLEVLVRYGAFDRIRKRLGAAKVSPPVEAPRSKARSVSSTVKLDEIAEGTSSVVLVGGTEVAVFKHNGRLVAVENRCPHEGSSLAEGSIEGSEIVCPGHGYRFHTETGACLSDERLRLKIFSAVSQGDGLALKEADGPQTLSQPRAQTAVYAPLPAGAQKGDGRSR